MRRILTLIAFLLIAATAAQAQIANQFVTISPNGKYLYNSITNRPVFMTGDTGWTLITQLDNADMETYLADRAARGFNVISVGAADNIYQTNAPKNFFGDVPFNGADFTNFNPAYWAHVDFVVQQAQAVGITLMINPAFVGLTASGGYINSYLSSSDATMTAYGTFLGNRYKHFPNIIWQLGGDANTPGTSGLLQKLSDLATGLAAADPNHLITYEACPVGVCGVGSNSSLDIWAGPPSWLGLNANYTQYGQAQSQCAVQYAKSPFLPPFEFEDWYELEHSMTELQLREEAYWEILSGCYVGRLFGNNAIWTFNSTSQQAGDPTWRSQLGSQGSVGQQFLGKLMNSREHWLMVPDTNNTVLTAGFGSGKTISVASRTSDGETIVAYIPNGNATTVTINMAKITSSSSTADAWWYNPQTAATTLIGSFANSGPQNFRPPDSNDWVLVIDDAAAGLPAPGAPRANPSPPSIASLNPSTAAAGGQGFTLRVDGGGFVHNSVVNFNGTPKATTFVSATQLTATILAADIVTAENANVTVTNPAPGGGTTSNFVFVISNPQNPVPTLTSIAPIGGALVQNVSLILTGTNFISASVVNFGSKANAGGVVSNGGKTLTITIPGSQLAAAGPLNVTVTNPAPGGGTTAVQTFTVNNLVPSIMTLSPASAAVNTGGFTLTLNGSNFLNASKVSINGVTKATTFVSSSQITAAILASDIIAVGTLPVTVTNPAPGGGTSTAVNFAVTNPPPTLSSIVPTSMTAGGAAFTLTVNGAGFVNGAKVNFGANPAIAPSSTTSTQIIATIPAAEIATMGTVSVTVSNPAPGGGTSSAQAFTINNPALTLASIAPTSAKAGGGAFTLTLNGSGFVSGAKVNFGANHSITPSSTMSTQIIATIPAADIATMGTVNVSVTNPAPGGGTSTNAQFTINNPVVGIMSLSPTSATTGGAAFTLTVNGTGFISSSVVNLNGATKTTTFKSATQLTAAIAAADILTAGVVNVTVTNPAPGGGTSNAAPFTINIAPPTLMSLSPSSATVGAGAFPLTVNGTGFVNGATVQISGVNRTTTFVSSTKVTAAILAEDVATPGTSAVTVTNPAPTTGPSAPPQTFTVIAVNNPVPAVTALGINHAAGGAAFTLTITGTNFVPKSVVSFNGETEVTTFVSPTKISAAIPAADVATAGNVNVTVMNPSPGGGTTAVSRFTVDGFSVSGPGVATIKAGGQAIIQINVAPSTNGFANPISFNVSGLPAHDMALFKPPVVTPNGKSTTTVLTITKPAIGATLPTPPMDRPWSPLLRSLLGLWIAALLGWLYAGPQIRRTPQLRRYAAIMPLSLLLVIGALMAGCAVGMTGTPLNNAPLTVTATSGTLTQTIEVTLTVTQ
jgi:hypothetical protein